MKLSLLLLGIILSIEANSQNLNGLWTANGPDWVFNLTMVQNGLTVSGNHCTVAKNGNRIDCSDDESDISVTGTANTTPITTVTFKSHYGSGQGRPQLNELIRQQLSGE